MSLVIPMILAAVGWGWDHLPLSVVLLMALVAFALVAFIWHRIAMAVAIQGLDPPDVKSLGHDLIHLAQRASATLAKFDRTATPEPEGKRARERAAAFYEAHIAEVAALIEVMKSLGISLPFFVSANRPDEMVTYLATIGELLKKERLAEAQRVGRSDSGFEFATLTRRPIW